MAASSTASTASSSPHRSSTTTWRSWCCGCHERRARFADPGGTGLHRLDRGADPRGRGARVRAYPGDRARRRPSPRAVARPGAPGAPRLRGARARRGPGRGAARAGRGGAAGRRGAVRAALARGGELLPVDSEHSAALQCLGGRPPGEVLRLTLTASGGPLRRHPDWRRATRDEVLAHPIWDMGRRITVDSATLMNKGLELIEAHALFELGWEQLDAVIHPQAIVHALATFTDGSTVLQAAAPDMRLPIQLALSWPRRFGPAVAPLSPDRLQGLEFEPLEAGRF